MKFVENDLLHLKNLIRALDVAKYPDLKGEDIVSFYRMFVWVSELSKKVEEEMASDAALDSVKIIKPELKTPVQVLKKPAKAKKTKGAK